MIDLRSTVQAARTRADEVKQQQLAAEQRRQQLQAQLQQQRVQAQLSPLLQQIAQEIERVSNRGHTEFLFRLHSEWHDQITGPAYNCRPKPDSIIDLLIRHLLDVGLTVQLQGQSTPDHHAGEDWTSTEQYWLHIKF